MNIKFFHNLDSAILHCLVELPRYNCFVIANQLQPSIYIYTNTIIYINYKYTHLMQGFESLFPVVIVKDIEAIDKGLSQIIENYLVGDNANLFLNYKGVE